MAMPEVPYGERMKHDELVAKIDANGTKYDGNTGITTEVVTRPHRNDKALRAVVELHKPMQVATGGSWTQDNFTQTFELRCPQCSRGYNQLYPCPTIQAIEKALNG